MIIVLCCLISSWSSSFTPPSSSSSPDPPESVWHTSANHSGKSLLLVGGEVVLRGSTHLRITFSIVIIIIIQRILKQQPHHRLSLSNRIYSHHTLTPNWPKPRPYRAREVLISATKKTVHTWFIDNPKHWNIKTLLLGHFITVKQTQLILNVM